MNRPYLLARDFSELSHLSFSHVAVLRIESKLRVSADTGLEVIFVRCSGEIGLAL